VRQAFLCAEGQGEFDRKAWIEHRLQELAEIFAVSVGGFALLDNHLHVLVRLDPENAKAWSAEEVARRWARLFPPKDRRRQPAAVESWIAERLKDGAWVARTRERLTSLGWFMKCLKEPLSRLCNREEQKRGAFFEGRYKSIALLDEEALLTVCAYIDLNPVAAGLAPTPEASEHTSLHQRIEHVQRQGRLEDLKAAAVGSVAASQNSADLEEGLWLCPLEDRRSLGSSREGMLSGFPLGSYLLLVDYTARLVRTGKAAMTRELAGIFERLEMSAELWAARLERLRRGRIWGRFFAGRRERLHEASQRLGSHHLANLSACPTP
jgi:hypothetical protein